MNAPSFQTVMKWSDDECRAYLETIRWPKGARCPKCGAENPYRITRKAESKNRLSSLYKCRACKKQFTATVGTIFEDSKIPLSKWFAAIALMCSSKKGISAHQLYRMLDLGSYRTAWFMCHRVREAMAEKIQLPFEGTVEADATFVGGKHRRGHRVYWEKVEDEISLGIRRADGSLKQGKNLAGKPHPRTEKAPVLGIVERGGKARTWVLKGKDESATEIRPILRQHLAPTVRLVTDAHGAYKAIKKYVRHDAVNHEVEYVNQDDPTINTQTIESYWSLLKRGMVGAFHHVERGYLPMYLSEFEFRWNRRQTSDAERFASLVGQLQGRLLWYCQTPQPENPFA